VTHDGNEHKVLLHAKSDKCRELQERTGEQVSVCFVHAVMALAELSRQSEFAMAELIKGAMEKELAGKAAKVRLNGGEEMQYKQSK
jgi:hypothetical protein